MAMPDGSESMDIDRVRRNELGQLIHSQGEVANCLELAYMKLGNHPELVRRVRQAAVCARSRHQDTSYMMKSYAVTSKNIVKTIIPLLKMAAKFKNEALMKTAFKQIQENAVAMKEETDKLRAGYKSIQQQVSDGYSEAFAVKKNVEETQSKLEMEMHSAKTKRDLADKAAKYSEEIVDACKTEVKRSEDKRDEAFRLKMLMGEKIIPSKKLDLGSAATLIGCSFYDRLMLAGGAIVTVGTWIYNCVSATSKNKQKEQDIEMFKEFEKSYMDATAQVERDKERIEKHRHELWDKKKEAIDNVQAMREMCSQHVSAGDPKCLLVVQENLGKVDAILTKIIEFWSSMAAVAQDILENGKTLPEILTGLDPAILADAPEEIRTELEGMLQTRIRDVEKGWNVVGSMCNVYIRDNDARLMRDFEFLSRPIDQMVEEDRRTRESKLFMLMEQEAEKAFATTVEPRICNNTNDKA